jgi:hypothetical protein
MAPSLPIAAAVAFLLLAGCSSDNPVLASEAVPEPAAVPVESTESASLDAGWTAWLSVCAPMVGAVYNYARGSAAEVDLSPPENLTAARLEFTWSPVNPTADALAFYLLDGDRLEFLAEGSSPVSADLAPEAATGAEGRLTVVAMPAFCPVAPANLASMPDQAVAVVAAYTALAVPAAVDA